MYAVIDQLCLIVEIDDGHTRRQRLIDLSDLFLDSLDHLLGIFVDSLEDDSGDDFALAIFGDCALADLVADLDPGNVAHTYRRAAARIEHDVLDVFDVLYQAQPAHDILFVAVFDEVCAGVLIIVLNGLKERFERDVVIDQCLLIDYDLVLFDVAAKAQYVSDTRHRAQLQFDDPILNRAQLLVALGVPDDLVEIDLAGAGGDRSHLRFES